MLVGGDSFKMLYTGADPGFQVREGAHLKKLRRAEGGANIFGVFRVKNHDFTPKTHIFSIAEGGAKICGVFRVKNHDFTPKNHIFSNFRGGGARAGCAPSGSAPDNYLQNVLGSSGPVILGFYYIFITFFTVFKTNTRLIFHFKFIP